LKKSQTGKNNKWLNNVIFKFFINCRTFWKNKGVTFFIFHIFRWNLWHYGLPDMRQLYSSMGCQIRLKKKFSKIKFVKTFPRNSMTRERLGDTDLLSGERYELKNRFR